MESQDVCYDIITAALAVQRIIEKKLKKFDLTLQGYQALEALYNDTEPLNVSSLALHMTGSNPDITRLLDRLLRFGLITRYRDDEDRRLVAVEITEKGEDVYLQARGGFSSAVDEVVRSIVPSHYETMKAAYEAELA